MKSSKAIIGIMIASLVAFVGIILFVIPQKNVTYKVIFDTDGGSIVESQKVKKNEIVKKPNDPSKEGYIFKEWTYEGKTYDFTQLVKSDLTLKANWIKLDDKVETFIVKFNSTGGTTISNQAIQKGNKVVKPSNPTKKGYTFVNWTYNGKVYDFNTKVEKNIELVANWKKIEEVSNNNIKSNNNKISNNTQSNSNKPNSNVQSNTNKPSNTASNTNVVKNYKVTFDSKGGSAVAPKTVEGGKTVSRPSNPTRNEYDFVEWQLNGKTFNFNTPINGNITLTAVWKSKIWDIDKATRSIVKYKGNATNLTIPSVIDGVSIVKINSNAFESNTLESVTIPASITTVEASAFLKSKNKNLTEVYMKDSLWKKGNWKSVFGTDNSEYITSDSGIFIKAIYKYDGCKRTVNSGACVVNNFVDVINSDGVYTLFLLTTDCAKANGVTFNWPVTTYPLYYVSSDTYTVSNLAYKNFKGWIEKAGDTPKKDLVIPKGSKGDKTYTAVCKD